MQQIHCSFLFFYSTLLMLKTIKSINKNLFIHELTHIDTSRHMHKKSYNSHCWCVLLCSMLCVPDSNWSLGQSATFWHWPPLHLWAVLCLSSAVSLSSFVSVGRGNTIIWWLLWLIKKDIFVIIKQPSDLYSTLPPADGLRSSPYRSTWA